MRTDDGHQPLGILSRFRPRESTRGFDQIVFFREGMIRCHPLLISETAALAKHLGQRLCHCEPWPRESMTSGLCL